MFVSDVESVVGLSKKSIRYYEEVGLINPKRNSENDYRIYSEEDIEKLKIIKFLRELDIPIRDIKLLNNGDLTLKSCMKERIRKIEREEENYRKIKNMCIELAESNTSYADISIEKYFRQMNILNKEGFTMRNVKVNREKKIKGAILSSILFNAFLMMIILIISYFQFTEFDKMPWIIYISIISLPLFFIISIFYSLAIRIKEINGGEEDEASKY